MKMKKTPEIIYFLKGFVPAEQAEERCATFKISAVVTSVQDNRVPQQDPRSGSSSGGDEECSVLWSQLVVVWWSATLLSIST